MTNTTSRRPKRSIGAAGIICRDQTPSRKLEPTTAAPTPLPFGSRFLLLCPLFRFSTPGTSRGPPHSRETAGKCSLCAVRKTNQSHQPPLPSMIFGSSLVVLSLISPFVLSQVYSRPPKADSASHPFHFVFSMTMGPILYFFNSRRLTYGILCSFPNRTYKKSLKVTECAWRSCNTFAVQTSTVSVNSPRILRLYEASLQFATASQRRFQFSSF